MALSTQLSPHRLLHELTRCAVRNETENNGARGQDGPRPAEVVLTAAAPGPRGQVPSLGPGLFVAVPVPFLLLGSPGGLGAHTLEPVHRVVGPSIPWGCGHLLPRQAERSAPGEEGGTHQDRSGRGILTPSVTGFDPFEPSRHEPSLPSCIAEHDCSCASL